MTHMVPLFELNEGDKGEIVEISEQVFPRGKRKRGGQCQCGASRIIDLGLRVGKEVTLLQKGHRGPLLVKVDESRIAIGRGMAERIKIKNSH